MNQHFGNGISSRAGVYGFLLVMAGGLALLAGSPARAQAVADRVYGQPNFTTGIYSNGTMPAAARLAKPRGLGVTEEGVYISDEGLNRVLFFAHDDTVASGVYGQWDFQTTMNNAPGLNANSLSKPLNIDVNATGLYVADWRNCRAVRFPLDSKTADKVYGQPNFGSSHPTWAGISARSITYPDGIAADGEGGAYVTDTFRTRVLYFPDNSQVATKVYGAPDFNTQMVSNGPQYFAQPVALAVDETGLYVVDQTQNRVLFFPEGSTTATRVYGQPNFYSTLSNAGGIGPNTLNYPSEVAVDSEGVYICDQGNNRVLYYPGTSTTATHVFGQPDFTSSTYSSNISASTLARPTGIAADDTAIYVSDYERARVLRFPKPGADVPRSVAFDTMPAPGVAGQVLQNPVVVQVRKADGSVAVNYSGPVRLRVVDGPDCSALRGTLRVNAVQGVAVFENVWLESAGTYRLAAQAGTLPGAVSDPFAMTASAGNSAGRADVDHDGQVGLLDVSRMMRALYGLDTL